LAPWREIFLAERPEAKETQLEPKAGACAMLRSVVRKSPSPILPVLLLLGALAAPGEAEARRKAPRRGQAPCMEGQREVLPQTPAYGGPGLGFEVSHVFEGRVCAKVLRTTGDGKFSLVEVGAGRVGWVATGLVEVELSEAKGSKAALLEEPKTLVAMRSLALLRQPRFDAKANAVVDKGSELLVTGRSPDGLWWFVKANKDEGWVSRYQVREALPEAGAAPSAGSGAWVVRPLAPPKDPPAAAVQKAVENQTEATALDEAGPVLDEDGEAQVALPAPRLLGRGHEVSFAVRFGTWSQRYLSDAQNDPFYRYDLESTGPAGALSYAFRGDSRLVGEVAAQAGLFGFNLKPPGEAEPVYTSVVTAQLHGQLGWRLYGDADLDLEAGAGAGLGLVWINDLEVAGRTVDAFTPGLYLDVLRPYVAARSRLGGGTFGLVSFEATVPLGAYAMVYDPGQKYLDDKPPVFDPSSPPVLTEPDGDAKPLKDREPPILHPAIGLEGRVRYAFPFGDVVRLRLGAGLAVRQVFLTGPGVRVRGVYTEATNLDVMGSVDLGMDFGF
jgi:hypothetical protein